MEKKVLRVRKNMDAKIELIDLFTSLDRVDCGNPFCDRQITSVGIKDETTTWLADDPKKPEDGILTCGHCGNFHGESLQAWENGDLFLTGL
jgi:hypothetical protein